MKSLLSLRNYLVFGMLLGISLLPLKAQESTSIPLAIKLEVQNNNATLTCTKGCEWKKITVATSNGQFDAKGSTTATKSTAKDFLIRLERKNGIIVLKGLKGTNWSELTTNCTTGICRIAINEFGLLH